MASANLKLIKGNDLDILIEAENLIKNGGPTLGDVEMLRIVADVIYRSDETTKMEFYSIIKPLLTLDSLLGFTYIKPHGYAGDFQIVDYVHTNHITEIEHLKPWDYLYQDLSASVALRNRKMYFNSFLDEEYKNKNSLKVLNIGSGPCRDIKEFLDARPDMNIQIECVDMDNTAIAYAKELCHEHTDKVEWVSKNAMRLRRDSVYDVVWSAGMFDYFNDKLFKALIKRYYTFLKPGGVLALGNINTTNQDRLVMEVYAQWYLHHRSEQDLVQLVTDCEIDREMLSINTEPTTVNIFAHIRK